MRSQSIAVNRSARSRRRPVLLLALLIIGLRSSIATASPTVDDQGRRDLVIGVGWLFAGGFSLVANSANAVEIYNGGRDSALWLVGGYASGALLVGSGTFVASQRDGRVPGLATVGYGVLTLGAAIWATLQPRRASGAMRGHPTVRAAPVVLDSGAGSLVIGLGVGGSW